MVGFDDDTQSLICSMFYAFLLWLLGGRINYSTQGNI